MAGVGTDIGAPTARGTPPPGVQFARCLARRYVVGMAGWSWGVRCVGFAVSAKLWFVGNGST